MFITKSHFQNPDSARKYLEDKIWSGRPICPHCGFKKAYPRTGKKIRPGTYRCGNNICRKDFTVTVGTLMERSHIPLHKWLLAMYLISSSKKGISSLQLKRMLEVSYKAAWFLSHRIREAMREDMSIKLGGDSVHVEVDETFWGNNEKKSPTARGYAHKMKVLALVERDANGQRNNLARSFHIGNTDAQTILKIVHNQIDRLSNINTDEAGQYRSVKHYFSNHKVVVHSAKEYVRGDATTNTVEGYFSLFKRGLIGIYHQVSEKHLFRYCGEFDFRWNTRNKNDEDRMLNIIANLPGKRLKFEILRG